MIASTFRSSAIAMLAAAALTISAPVGALAARRATSSVTPVDIQRLQDRVFGLSSDLSRLRSRDASTASRLEGDLDDLRDEVVYLRVKLRKEGRVQRSEYADLRDRLDSLGSRIRGEGSPSSSSTYSSSPSAPPAVERPRDTSRVEPPPPDLRTPESTPRASSGRRGTREIPVGQELDIRLQTPLSSDTAQVEDRFEATTIVDMYEGNQLLVPAGSVLRGVVSSVKRAGRLERKGVLTLSFDQLTVDGRDYPIRATVTQAIESTGVRGEAGKIGAGAGVGAIIGGILGGFKGALAGILIGGGGTIAATEGTDVKLDSGTILRIRFDSPVPLERTSSSR